ncbi:type VII secretion target [Streptomyces sp. NPDC052225]|uniref:type VII secretion target n=1 Tax=Streptomyces sp. NPDC052225 TaxID=3154949 RepID=UPI003448396D
MHLKVTPSDLEGYGRQIGRAAEDVVAFKGHCSKYTRIGASSQGLINLALTTHAATVQEVTGAFDKLYDILTAASAELEKTAAYYVRTDRAVAARVDATYSQVKRPAK